MTALLSPKTWVALAVAAALAFAGFFLYRAGKATVRADFEAYKAAQAEARILADRANRNTERTWQDKADQTTKAKDEQILNINARLDDALGRLRDRPTRPAGDVPARAVACKGATGAGIYAEDAGLLIREAARADKLRAALAACYSQYDAISQPVKP